MIAAVLTPPDVISQLSLAMPLMVLYEGSIWSVRFVEKKAAAEAAAKAAGATPDAEAGGVGSLLPLAPRSGRGSRVEARAGEGSVEHEALIRLALRSAHVAPLPARAAKEENKLSPR